MSDTVLPERPDEIAGYILDGLDRQTPEKLRTIATYAEHLADHKERERQREIEVEAVDKPEEAPNNWSQDDWNDALADADAPSRATLTTKTIDGRDYYYYQWHEKGKTKSEYIAPVSPARRGGKS